MLSISAGLGILLFLLGYIGVLAGYLHHPPGYSPLFVYSDPFGDIGQHLVWMIAGRSSLAVTDFAAPWATARGQFVPFFSLIGQLCRIPEVTPVIAYNIAWMGLYILATYSFLLAIKTFCKSRTEVLATLLVVICAIPPQLYFYVPSVIIPRLQPVFFQGIGKMLVVSDGFMRPGWSAGVTLTLGTTTVLLGASALGRYAETKRERYLIWAGIAGLASALFHPFEVFLIGAAGLSVILFESGFNFQESFRPMLTFGFLCSAGLIPAMVLALEFRWVHDLSLEDKYVFSSVFAAVRDYGLPVVFTLLLLLYNPRLKEKTDLVLEIFRLRRSTGLRSFHTIQASSKRWIPIYLRDAFGASGRLFANSLRLAWQFVSPRMYRILGHDLSDLSCGLLSTIICRGSSANPSAGLTSVMPNDELQLIDWLRTNTSEDHLALSPLNVAPWIVTVPIHSFASHNLMSIRYAEQASLANRFFRGQMNPSSVDRFLSDYGIRWVIVPEDSAALGQLDSTREAAKIGRYVIFGFPGHQMKPYPRQR